MCMLDADAPKVEEKKEKPDPLLPAVEEPFGPDAHKRRGVSALTIDLLPEGPGSGLQV